LRFDYGLGEQGFQAEQILVCSFRATLRLGRNR
jgi:hypothetical protein